MAEYKDLLELLDLPEKDLREAVSRAFQFSTALYSLADLAFRLRDEVVRDCRYKYDDAIIQVYSVSKKSAEEFHWWWIRHSQPIHIIVAALIARRLSEKQ